MNPMPIAHMAAWYAVFLFSATIHEAAHAWAAMRGGDLTAYHGGQVSFDPLPHIRREPFGMVVLPILSLLLIQWPFGYASAPYDPFWARRYPRRSALMALAGPAANFALMACAGIIIRIAIAAGWFIVPDYVGFAHIAQAKSAGTFSAIATLISIIFTLNLIMTVLNLIPLPPLDGSSVITLFMSESAVRRYERIVHNPGLAIFGLFIAWQILAPLLDIVFAVVVNVLYPGQFYG